MAAAFSRTMHRVLYVVSALAAGFGAYVFSQGPTITQQVAGLILWLIATVLFVGAAIVQAVLSLAPGEKELTAEELHEKQVREVAARLIAPPAVAAEPRG